MSETRSPISNEFFDNTKQYSQDIGTKLPINNLEIKKYAKKSFNAKKRLDIESTVSPEKDLPNDFNAFSVENVAGESALYNGEFTIPDSNEPVHYSKYNVAHAENGEHHFKSSGIHIKSNPEYAHDIGNLEIQPLQIDGLSSRNWYAEHDAQFYRGIVNFKHAIDSEQLTPPAYLQGEFKGSLAGYLARYDVELEIEGVKYTGDQISAKLQEDETFLDSDKSYKVFVPTEILIQNVINDEHLQDQYAKAVVSTTKELSNPSSFEL